jgi:ubiquinone/menaquinone biosynthesis C-methylase UbiE
MRLAKLMRQDWDARAQKDAFYYIASWRKHWDSRDFLKSGEDDYQRLVAPFLSRHAFDPVGKTMLELGCGAGRMTHCFATHFRRVIAVDVSAEMIDRAKQLAKDAENVLWKQANGVDLSDTQNESVDFVFSYLVLQHFPDVKLVQSHIRELIRVLKPFGIGLFQFNGMKGPTMNWRGSIAWGLVDMLWAIRLPKLSRFTARCLGFDPAMAGKTWHGVSLDTRTVKEAVTNAGGIVLEFSDPGTRMAWCCARKT